MPLFELVGLAVVSVAVAFDVLVAASVVVFVVLFVVFVVAAVHVSLVVFVAFEFAPLVFSVLAVVAFLPSVVSSFLSFHRVDVVFSLAPQFLLGSSPPYGQLVVF